MTDTLTRYRDRNTGSVVRVDDETAKTLGATYEKVTDAQLAKLRAGATAQKPGSK